MTIQGVSEIKALGIVVEYSSLSHLMEAYRAVNHDEDAMTLLSNIHCQLKGGSSKKDMKIGAALSRKICIALCSRDPNLLIAK